MFLNWSHKIARGAAGDPFLQLIQAVYLLAALGFAGAKSLGAAFQQGNGLMGAQGVPVSRGGAGDRSHFRVRECAVNHDGE